MAVYKYRTSIPATNCYISNFQDEKVAKWLFPNLPLKVETSILFGYTDKEANLIDDLASLSQGYELRYDSTSQKIQLRKNNVLYTSQCRISFLFPECSAVSYSGIDRGNSFEMLFENGSLTN